MGDEDIESEHGYVEVFKERRTRHAFISKVFAILSAQLFTVVVIIAAIVIPESHRDFFGTGTGFILTMSFWVLFGISYYTLMCYGRIRKAKPWNWILLFILTISLAVASGGISARYETHVVLLAFLLTCLVCFVITFLACCCPCDITKCYGYIMILAVVVIILSVVFIVVNLWIGYIRLFHQIIAGLSCLLFSLFLWFDIQAVMGGRRVELAEDEYIYAAIQLYVDIVQIFLNMLTLMSR